MRLNLRILKGESDLPRLRLEKDGGSYPADLRLPWRLAVAAAGWFSRSVLTTVVITVFGVDRPGLVESVAGRVSAHGGNWLESRLLHLGGHFAGIVRIEIDEQRHAALMQALEQLQQEGLSVVAHHTGTPAGAAAAGLRVSFDVVGQDRPGIVREIARALASEGVNVEELTTERSSAPMTGEPIFRAEASILLPGDRDPAELREQLERIASGLGVDLRFRT